MKLYFKKIVSVTADTNLMTRLSTGGSFFKQRYPLLLLCLGIVFNLTWLPRVLAATDCTQVTEIPQLECEALIALYDSTNGPNWKDSSFNNWKVTNTPCSWRGVGCHAGHVKRLDRPNGGLIGTIPSELENLSQLQSLKLPSNQLLGTIPSELGNLNQLLWLELDRNQLSGSIPSELGNLSQLWELNLFNNQLSGFVPSELGNLNRLQKLSLFGNQLSGSIPSELGNLSQLGWLSLYDNQLSGSIPSELGYLSQLRELHLFDNQLSGSIPSELKNLSKLIRLNLCDNQLSGSIPSELGNLMIVELSLCNNQLSGSIPSELGNLSRLLKLNLSHNQLSGTIPSELGNLSRLSQLYLDHNQLSGYIPSSLSLLRRNMNLDLGYNYLTVSDPQLISFLNWTDSDWAETQGLPIIECGNEGSVNINPFTLDFGSEAVGHSNSLTINTRSQGCGDLQVDTIEFTGNHADEFTAKNKDCQEGESQGQTFSSCQFTLVFFPTSAGIKEAILNFTFNDDSVIADPMQLLATAVDPAQPNLAVSPMSHDFGTITLGRGPFDSQTFTLTNTGNVNLKFETIALTGTAAAEFSKNDDCSHKQFLRPDEQCQIYIQFMPLSLGEKPANLHLTFLNGLEQNIPLNGTVTEPGDCSEANITITSVGSGAWDSSATWNSGTFPTTSDVVQINSGHTITAIPFAQVRALCIEMGGRLESLDNQGTRLEIQATDYLQNKGTILGKDGLSETTPCSNPTEVGNESCAYPGASVILKVGTAIQQHDKAGDQWWYAYQSGGPIFNTGEIHGGQGGNGSQYAAAGGDVIVLGRDTTNTGRIQAGNGGHLTGTGSGTAGQGGLTQIWGKLGGPGHLYNQNGAQALAGQGGDCNPSATEPQQGGRGGNLWLVSLPDVHLSGGQHTAGHGGINCIPSGGRNGDDGWVRIEPNLIDLSTAATQVSGGDVAIYGGENFLLDLTNLSGTVITATGDITLAVGKGGLIDLSGSTGTILQADGQVQLFADTIVLDEDVLLADLIQATDIVVGPNKIRREVSLTGAGKVIGKPEVTLPVNLTLANNGTESDTYTLSVTDTAGWTLNGLPATVELDGLNSIDLVLNVTLPATRGATDVITLTATSAADAEVKSTTSLYVAVAELTYTLSGTIQNQLGHPLPNLTAEIADKTGVTDAQGRFEIIGLLPGDYTLTISNPDRQLATQALTLTGTNSTIEMEIALDMVLNPASCQLYAVNDGQLNDSQFFTISLDETHAINELGPLYPGHDIEALAIDPQTDLIYAASGNDVSGDNPKGYLYLVDGETGELFPVGSTGFEEIGDLSFSPDGTLWAWAKGAGLITIDTITGVGTIDTPSNLLVEGLTLTPAGSFFGAVQTKLWRYDQETNTLAVACPNLLGETEALETIADGWLLVGTHQVPFGWYVLNTLTCELILVGETLSNQFRDVEGIAMPVAACAQ
ncbi:MAG: choice-of-anchor D domain-containing protein [Thioploca sp.]|nr:choice-of-anchor D domain-containing protein [Thioploca sp.]